MSNQYVVAALYKFTKLEDFEALKPALLEKMEQEGVRGSILLASEGINGTIAGMREGIDAVLAHIKADPRLTDLDHKESFSDFMPFPRTKVRLKEEIVRMKVPGIDPNRTVGTYIKPEDWNALIEQDDVVLVDTRNGYEVRLGTFEGAVDPQTESFGQFPDWVEKNLDPHKHKKVAMFCTGGIRCEKSTAYLLEQGFEEVYHLKGGILKYLEDVPAEQSKWNGECFVFDHRVSVTHGLEVGDAGMCYACGMPLTQEEMTLDTYMENTFCPYCVEEKTAKKQANEV